MAIHNNALLPFHHEIATVDLWGRPHSQKERRPEMETNPAFKENVKPATAQVTGLQER